MAFIALLFGLSGCASPTGPPLPTVKAVNLARYMGTWYEISRLPNRFQAICASDTQARYQLDGERVKVTNRCRRVDGRITEAEGQAESVAGSHNARLRVSFFRPFYGDYWILVLDPDYQWVLVGEPRRRYAWILARTPTLDQTIVTRILTRATQLGFAQEAFQRTPQSPTLD